MSLQKLEKKMKLEKEINDLELKIRSLPRVSDLRFYETNRQSTLDKFIKDREENPDLVSSCDKADREYLRQEVMVAKNKADAAEKKEQELRDELAGLKRTYANLSFQVTKKEVIDLQLKKSTIEKTIERLQTAIKDEEKNDAGVLPDAGQQLSLLTSKREEMLADIVIGEDVDEKELRLIEEKIADAEQNHSSQVDSAIETFHTINGLRNKLIQQKSELERVERQHLDAFSVFLKQELDTAGQDYVTLSNKLSATFTRIASWDKILRGCGKPAGIFPFECNSFKIPKVNLDACNPGEGSRYLFQYERINNIHTLRMAESDLVKMGLDIPK